MYVRVAINSFPPQSLLVPRYHRFSRWGRLIPYSLRRGPVSERVSWHTFARKGSGRNIVIGYKTNCKHSFRLKRRKPGSLSVSAPQLRSKLCKTGFLSIYSQPAAPANRFPLRRIPALNPFRQDVNPLYNLLYHINFEGDSMKTCW